MPNSGRKLVAIALADMANDDGTCWPSLKTLMGRCNMCEASIRNHLQALEAMGIIKAEPRFSNGRQTSNSYVFVNNRVTGEALHLEGGRVSSFERAKSLEGSKKCGGEGIKKLEGGGYQKLIPHEPSYRTIIESSPLVASASDATGTHGNQTSKPKPGRKPKTADPRHQPFVAAFCESYQTQFGEKYYFQPRDAKALQRFLKACNKPVEELIAALRWCWSRANNEYAPGFLRAATIIDFTTAWPKIVTESQK